MDVVLVQSRVCYIKQCHSVREREGTPSSAKPQGTSFQRADSIGFQYRVVGVGGGKQLRSSLAFPQKGWPSCVSRSALGVPGRAGPSPPLPGAPLCRPSGDAASRATEPVTGSQLGLSWSLMRAFIFRLTFPTFYVIFIFTFLSSFIAVGSQCCVSVCAAVTPSCVCAPLPFLGCQWPSPSCSGRGLLCRFQVSRRSGSSCVAHRLQGARAQEV